MSQRLAVKTRTLGTFTDMMTDVWRMILQIVFFFFSTNGLLSHLLLKGECQQWYSPLLSNPNCHLNMVENIWSSSCLKCVFVPRTSGTPDCLGRFPSSTQAPKGPGIYGSMKRAPSREPYAAPTHLKALPESTAFEGYLTNTSVCAFTSWHLLI